MKLLRKEWLIMKTTNVEMTFNALYGRRAFEESEYLELQVDRYIRDLYFRKLNIACDALSLPKSYIHDYKWDLLFALFIEYFKYLDTLGDVDYFDEFVLDTNDVIVENTRISNRIQTDYYNQFTQKLNANIEKLMKSEYYTINNKIAKFIILEAALNHYTDEFYINLIYSIACKKMESSLILYKTRIEKINELKATVVKKYKERV